MSMIAKYYLPNGTVITQVQGYGATAMTKDGKYYTPTKKEVAQAKKYTEKFNDNKVKIKGVGDNYSTPFNSKFYQWGVTRPKYQGNVVPSFKYTPVYYQTTRQNELGGSSAGKEHTFWDWAHGTDSGALATALDYQKNNSEGYAGIKRDLTLEDKIKLAQESEAEVYKAVQGLSKAKTHGYIKNIDTGELKHFQFNPETLHYAREVDYTDNRAPGMAYPRTQFVGGKTREFDLNLFMYDRQLEPCGIIKDYMCFFGQFLTPEENVAHYERPPQMLLSYGYFVRKCVLRNFDIEILTMDGDGTPTQANFVLTLRQVGVV